MDFNFLKFPPTRNGRRLEDEEESQPKIKPLGNDHLIYPEGRDKRPKRGLQREGFDFDEYKSRFDEEF